SEAVRLISEVEQSISLLPAMVGSTNIQAELALALQPLRSENVQLRRSVALNLLCTINPRNNFLTMFIYHTILFTCMNEIIIVVRDPNQDNKDITEEIISEAGRSQKPTLPVGNVFSVSMPLKSHYPHAFHLKSQQLNQVVENERVYNVDRAQGPPAPADLKPADPSPAQAVTPKPDKTEPVHVPPEVPASALFTIDEPKQTRLLVLTTPNRSE
ncbi:coiled-coil domain-containing protein 14 isoform X2, partial [Silurus meridionalis]